MGGKWSSGKTYHVYQRKRRNLGDSGCLRSKEREASRKLQPPHSLWPWTFARRCSSKIIQFRSRDFRSVHNLSIDNKLKSQMYLDPHFNPETHLSQLDQSKKASFLQSNPGADLAKTSMIHTHDSYRPANPYMSRYGEIDTLKEAKRNTGFKFYDNFTKRFDQTHMNTKLRGPQYIN